MTNERLEQAMDEYLKRLRIILNRAPVDVREDVVREVRTHIEDEWQALGGSEDAMHVVLERLGPPEEYGRDLALQLIVHGGSERRSFLRVFKGAVFWASTSLMGSLLVLTALAFFVFAVGMGIVAVIRLSDSSVMLINGMNISLPGFNAQNLRFPPVDWSPLVIILIGLLPSVMVFALLFHFFSQWARNPKTTRGLELITGLPQAPFTPRWERRAFLAMLAFGLIGTVSCLLFTIAGDAISYLNTGVIHLPEDIFRGLLMFLAFIGLLVFACAPVLGILWASKK